jgi:Holliday junction resolvasome RuvABC endonuclease subunit
LDLSLTNTGIAVYKDGHIETFSIASPLRGTHRLRDLRDRMRRVLDCNVCWTGKVIGGVEGYSFGSTSRHHALGEWGGVAKLELLERGVVSYIGTPTTVKKFITCKGNTPKKEVRLHLRQRYGISVEQEDEADAACVSILIGAFLHGDAFSLTSPQKDALAAVELMV